MPFILVQKYEIDPIHFGHRSLLILLLLLIFFLFIYLLISVYFILFLPPIFVSVPSSLSPNNQQKLLFLYRNSLFLYVNGLFAMVILQCDPETPSQYDVTHTHNAENFKFSAFSTVLFIYILFLLRYVIYLLLCSHLGPRKKSDVWKTQNGCDQQKDREKMFC